jgi:hypothetical protein
MEDNGEKSARQNIAVARGVGCEMEVCFCT